MSLKALIAAVVLVYAILFLCGQGLGGSLHQCISGCAQDYSSLGAPIGETFYRFGEYFAPVMGGVLTLAGVALTIRHQRDEGDRADSRQMRLVEKNHRLAIRPAIKLYFLPASVEGYSGPVVRLGDFAHGDEVCTHRIIKVELLNANIAEHVEVTIVGNMINSYAHVASFEVLAHQFETQSRLVGLSFPGEEFTGNFRAYCVVSFYDVEGISIKNLIRLL